MRTIPLGKTGLAVPAVALGCMRLTALDERGAQTYVRTALEYGANIIRVGRAIFGERIYPATAI